MHDVDGSAIPMSTSVASNTVESVKPKISTAFNQIGKRATTNSGIKA